MIKQNEVEKALQLIADYEQQLQQTHVISSAAYQVGCRVKLSKHGLEMQGRRKAKLVGTVIAYRPWVYNPTTDGIATVKWDGISKPDTMHVSQIEPLK